MENARKSCVILLSAFLLGCSPAVEADRSSDSTNQIKSEFASERKKLLSKLDSLNASIRETTDQTQLFALRSVRSDVQNRLHNYELAVDDANFVRSVSPRKARGLHGYFKVSLSNIKDAIDDFTFEIEKRKSNKQADGDLRTARAPLYLLTENYPGAIGDLDQLLAHGWPKLKNQYLNLKALSLYKQNNFDSAMTVLNEILANDPTDSLALNTRSQVNRDTKQLDAALQDANDAIAVNQVNKLYEFVVPGPDGFLRVRSSIYARLNKPDRALADLEVVRLIDRGKGADSTSLLELAKSFHDRGNDKVAKRLCLRFIDESNSQMKIAQSLLNRVSSAQ